MLLKPRPKKPRERERKRERGELSKTQSLRGFGKERSVESESEERGLDQGRQ